MTITITPGIQKALDAARGSKTGAIVACALGVERDAQPRFTSPACLTSDGFLQASFVTASGEGKHSAFVGTYTDFKRGVENLADFAKLEGDERAAYAKALNEWVAVRYSTVEPVK